jgi:hypothetical protein
MPLPISEVYILFNSVKDRYCLATDSTILLIGYFEFVLDKKHSENMNNICTVVYSTVSVRGAISFFTFTLQWANLLFMKIKT